MASGPEPRRTLKINEIVDPKYYKVSISSQEAPAELKARLAREDAEAAHQRRKDFVLFLGAVAGIGSIAGLCLWIALRPSSTPDDKKWATSVLTSVVAGAVGYLFGKSSK